MFWVSFYDAQLCSLDSYLLFVRFLLVTVHHHGKLPIHKSCIDLDCANHSECLCPVSGILSSWYPCLCPRLSEDQSWLSRSRSGTCLSLRWWLLATGTPGPHWPRHGLSLVTWPHLWPLIGQIWTTASQVLLSSLVSGWLCGRHLAPRRPPGVCLNTRSESHDWGERGRILLWGIHLDNAAQRLGPASDTPESGGVRGRLTTQFMAPVSFAAPAPRNFGYLIIERRNIPSQVSKMIMNYPSLETGASNKQRNCLHFSVCIYSLGQTRNKCSNSIKVSRKCNRSPSLPSPQLRIDCLLHKNKNQFPANVSLRRKMAMAMIYGVLLWLPKSFLQESIFSFK